mmetsp:Transcript_85660/g.171470  ORF Transcript_85660/g.171470 Transcript_85660/m.171470 type:complete len:215 (-) Transcript_85660:561-1205(-)
MWFCQAWLLLMRVARLICRTMRLQVTATTAAPTAMTATAALAFWGPRNFCPTSRQQQRPPVGITNSNTKRQERRGRRGEHKAKRYKKRGGRIGALPPQNFSTPSRAVEAKAAATASTVAVSITWSILTVCQPTVRARTCSSGPRSLFGPSQAKSGALPPPLPLPPLLPAPPATVCLSQLKRPDKTPKLSVSWPWPSPPFLFFKLFSIVAAALCS